MENWKSTSAKSRDEIRTLLLLHLYRRRVRVSDIGGQDATTEDIGELLQALKSMHDLSPSEVMPNLKYLVGRGLIYEQFTHCADRHSPLSMSYAMTARGIDWIEGPRQFTRGDGVAGIVNIVASQNATVTVVGGASRVHVSYEEGATALAPMSEIPEHPDLDTALKAASFQKTDPIESPHPGSSRRSLRAVWRWFHSVIRIAALAKFLTGTLDRLAGFLALLP
jgi:hypothetical protein